MHRSIRWFVIAVAMLIATVSTWAFLTNLVGPLLAPGFEFGAAGDDPSSPKWNFFGPFEKWDPAEPASSLKLPPEPPMPPWWFITARAPNPYWAPWLAGPVGTISFGTLSLAALVLIVFVARTPKVKP